MNYKFIKNRDINNEYDITDIEMRVETVECGSLIDEFKNFLIACGFSSSCIRNAILEHLDSDGYIPHIKDEGEGDL